MMITTVERRYSLDEYRAIEEKAEERSEYRDGEIVPMSGGSLNHSRIGGNIFAFLKFMLRDSKCEPIERYTFTKNHILCRGLAQCSLVST